MPNKFDFDQVSEREHQPIQIFISYSRKDSQYVDGFRSHLSTLNAKKKRIGWYIDREKVELNELWRDRITLEIMKAKVFVFFMSSDAFESEFVREELEMAIKRKQKEKDFAIVPFLIRDCPWKKSKITQFTVFPTDGKCVADYGALKDKAYLELADHIDKFISQYENQKRSDETETEFPRPWKITESFLESFNGIYYKIEKTLSMESEYWKDGLPQNHEWGRSFGAMYFARQSEHLCQIQQELNSISTGDAFFPSRLKKFLPLMENTVIDCRVLLEASDVKNIPLFTSLQETERHIEKLKDDLALKSNARALDKVRKDTFPTLKHYLKQLITKMDKLKNDFNKMSSSNASE